MSALAWIFGIALFGYLGLRLFGRRLVQYALLQLRQRLLNEARRQSQAYENNYDERERHLFMNDDLKVSTPRKQHNRHVREDDIADDIDYEEVK
ncbi:MAG: hypothetical protein OHK0039_45080 [Bacteroidia bacterium]